MPQSEPVTILIVSEQAEAIKLVTISLRGFFPSCRVEVVYSAEEARTWTSAHEWTLILIDEQCLAGAQTSLPSELKQRAPYAAIILHSDRTDSAAAIQALQADIDFFLSKHSPAFLTELLFCAKEAIEKHSLRVALDHAHERYRRLIESLNNIVYELDASGRFVTVSSGVAPLLGYSPDELIGLPYTTLVPPGQESASRYRFNERRSGTRGTSRAELIFRGKATQDHAPRHLTAEVSARGLYDPLRRFLGTVGFIRDLSQPQQQDRTIDQLRRQLQQTDERLALAQRVTRLSRQLHDPLTALLTDSQRLLTTIRDARLHDQIETLAGHATEATKLDAQLTQALHDTERNASGLTINDVLDDLLTSMPLAIVGGPEIMRKFSSQLPPLAGDRELVTRLIQHLVNYTQTYVLTVGRPHQLILSTNAVGPPSTLPGSPALAPPTEVEIELLESEVVRSAEPVATSPQPLDLIESYQLIRQLGGTLDLSAPMQGPLRITVRLPAVPRPPLDQPPLPINASVTPSILAADTGHATTTTVLPSDPGKPHQERRHTPRIPTALPATITVGSVAWDGTISNLSLGGTCVTLPGNFPTLPPQDAYVVVKTTVGILELHGRAQERSVSLQTKTPSSQIIVTFEAPEREEKAVLASLVQAAQEQALPFSLEVLLAEGPPPALHVAHPRAKTEGGNYHPREAVRVALQLPVRLDITDSTGRSHRLGALTTNLSRDGVGLHLNARPELMSGLVTLHFAATQTQNHPGTHEPGAPDAALPARLIWSTQDPVAPSEFLPPGSDPALRVGVRFQALTPYAEREVNRVVRQHLTSLSESEPSLHQASVVSLPRECRNPRGQTIVIADDHLHQSLAPNTPVVVIAPGYGQTALDAITLSYYLAHHRLRVLRYDHTNHVGLSGGELQQTTLRSMQADLLKVVEFVQHTWPTAPLIVMASDMAARVALKMAVQSRLDLLLLINPVVDVQAMLMTVHRHDLVADHRYGLRRGVANLLGLNVNMDRFVGDIVAGHFTDLASTIADLRLLRSPSAILTIPSSPLGPLPPADLPQAFLTALGAHTRLATVSAPLTGQDLPLNEQHPPAFRQILEQIAATVSLPAAPVEFSEHTRHALNRQQRIEMERTRLHHNLSHITREALWVAHLQQLPQLGNLHEYWKLLDDFYRLLGPLDPGSLLLDAEAGHGDLLRATMVNQAYRSRQRGWSPEPPVHAIGGGRSHDSLTRARQSLRALQGELDSDFAGTLTIHPPLTTQWVHTDWTQGLPFKNDSLHRIVCNLSLPFVPSPLVTVRELYRVLHPQGRLVLTVFHPETDLSVLYRHHLHRANQDEFSPQAQILLQYMGRLREAIRHGLLHTFEQSSLSSFLLQAGIVAPRILPALEGQAFFAIIEKSKSAS